MTAAALRTPLAAFFGLLLLLCGVSSCGDGGSSGSSPKPIEAGTRAPLDVVNDRMSAYNRHDLRAFTATYAPEVEFFTYPDKSLGRGHEHLRSIFEPMFERGVVQVTVHHQVAKDSYVINHETVDERGTQTEYVSIYEVRGDLIQSVRFVRD